MVWVEKAIVSHREERRHTCGGEGDTKTEAEVGLIQAHAKEIKECREPPELEEARKGAPLEALQEAYLCRQTP